VSPWIILLSVRVSTNSASSFSESSSQRPKRPAGVTPSGVTAADLNGDGKPDVVVANFGSNSLSIVLNIRDRRISEWKGRPPTFGVRRLHWRAGSPVPRQSRYDSRPARHGLRVVNREAATRLAKPKI